MVEIDKIELDDAKYRFFAIFSYQEVENRDVDSECL